METDKITREEIHVKFRVAKEKITTDSGKQIEATAPVIISASRSTDIPAFYAKWFFNRLAKGVLCMV